MKVYLNDEPTNLLPDSSLFDSLKQSGMHDKKGIAVAVNSEIVSKNSWQERLLKENDRITVVTATQGG